MLYDLSDSPPPPRSLLESVFLLLAKRRQEAEYYKTQAIIAGTLSPHSSDTSAFRGAMDAYKDAVFPFLKGEKEKETRNVKASLKHWAEKVAFKVRPLWRAKEHKGLVSKLRRGKERIQRSEELRRRKHYRRI